MPGPRNQKKKKPAQNKKAPGKKELSPQPIPIEEVEDAPCNTTPASNSSQDTVHTDRGPGPTLPPATPPPAPSSTAGGAANEPAVLQTQYEHDSSYNENAQEYPLHRQEQEHAIYPQVQHPTYPSYSPYPEEPAGEPAIPASLLKPPFIHDPGSGPRVKDVRAFLESRLASPPSLDDPLCGEFADEAVLQMLCTVLPEETAMVRRHAFSSNFVPTTRSSDTVV